MRTISASFGFAFGTSASPSSDHTPISQERSPKGVKSSLQNVVSASGASIISSDRSPKQLPCSIAKPSKKRKRWAPREDAQDVEAANEAVNSFIASITTKRSTKGAANTNQAWRDTQEVVPKPEPKTSGRPRKRAVKAATTKVGDDLVTEALPIDKQRRNLEPLKKTRSRIAKQKRESEVLAKPADVVLEGETDGRSDLTSLKRQTRAMPKTKTTGKSVPSRKALPLPQGDLPEEVHAVGEAGEKSSERTSDKRKRVDHDSTQNLKRSDEGLGGSNSDKHVDAARFQSSEAIREKGASKNAVRKATHEPVGLDPLPSQLSTVELHRQPLKEVDSNSPVRARPLGKRRACDAKVDERSSKKSKVYDNLVTTDNNQIRPQKRRKTSIEVHKKSPEAKFVKRPMDNADIAAGAQDILQISASRCEEVYISGRLRESESKPVALSTTKKATSKAKSRKASKVEVEAPIEQTPELQQVSLNEDEDVDWLFEPQQPKRLQALPATRTAGPKKGPRTPRKMADIDLDDLLSDIASFAKVDDWTSRTSAASMPAKGRRKAPGKQQRQKN